MTSWFPRVFPGVRMLLLCARSWRRLLALLRDAFFPADKRVGGTWVYGDGVEGTLRALLLVAKVGARVRAFSSTRRPHLPTQRRTQSCGCMT